MKHMGWMLVLALSVTPAWCAKKMTVGELQQMLASMHRASKSDAEVANALKQVELSEQLTRPTMNSLVSDVPGTLSTEQIYVLEARSADLTPPESDLPSTPAPDEPTRQALLGKARQYVQNTYAQLPSLSVTKTTLRFQDTLEAVANSSGQAGSAKEVTTTSGFSSTPAYVRYIGATDTSIASWHGAESAAQQKDSTRWGANGMIALQNPAPSLDAVFRAAQTNGDLHWLRWELVNGKPAAVFAFAVPKDSSKLNETVCCFPKIDQAGRAIFYSATTASVLGGSGPGGGAAGNFQTNTEWQAFKAVVPYHGEFFIDPQTGIVVRMIVEAEFRPTDVVHRLDTRIDYGVVSMGDKSLVLPVKSFVNTEVVPNGDSGAGGYKTRCTLFTAEYKDYKLAMAK